VVKFDHAAIPVSDWRRSRDWYIGNLGFRLEFEVEQGGREGLGVAALQEDAGFTLFLEQLSGPVQSGQAVYTLQVDDVDALHARLMAEGVAFAAPPSKQFWGYGAVLHDPDGHVLNLWDERSMAAKG
jgi:catechol 2,3-dioxygenase-like lactoylglutathione lyase family enzyme